MRSHAGLAGISPPHDKRQHALLSTAPTRSPLRSPPDRPTTATALGRNAKGARERQVHDHYAADMTAFGGVHVSVVSMPSPSPQSVQHQPPTEAGRRGRRIDAMHCESTRSPTG